MNRNNILFLGNGINLLFHTNISWNALLAELSEGEYTENTIMDMECPLPLKAILVTNDHVDERLRSHKKSFFGESTIKQNEYIQQFFDLGFEEIITTNYSYELEMAALNRTTISEYYVEKKLSSHSLEVSRVEPKYLLHSYNNVKYKNIDRHIWHIHGEVRKPDSMVLGHYYYGNLTAELKKLSEKRKDSYKQETFVCKSWMDHFILDNVYILGFRYDLNEIDLWWLLNRKKREKAVHGKVYFYDIYRTDIDENQRKGHDTKIDLLELLEVEVVSFSFVGNDYREAYDKAVLDIKKKLQM